jgi:hypothetical protein
MAFAIGILILVIAATTIIGATVLSFMAAADRYDPVDERTPTRPHSKIYGRSCRSQAFDLAATAPVAIIAIPPAAMPTYLTFLGDSRVAEWWTGRASRAPPGARGG